MSIVPDWVRAGTLLRSDNGRGRLRAQIERVDGDGQVQLCRWAGPVKPREYGNKLTRFTLASHLFVNGCCGWKPAKGAPHGQ